MNPNKPIKRSSLKMSTHFTQQDLMAIQQKNKRNSVNWASSIPSVNTNLKEMKTTFDIIEEEPEAEHKKKTIKSDPNTKFEAARRESIKNEFTLAKKYLKENKIESLETEEDEIEETQKNTMKNREVGIKEKSDNNSKDSQSSDGEEN